MPRKYTCIPLLFLFMLLAAACHPLDPTLLNTSTPNAQSTETDHTTNTTAVPGVTDDRIILGVHTPLTGPLSNFSQITKVTNAYFAHINKTEGGIYGREIVYLMEDDAFQPPQTVEVTTKLLEDNQIFAMVGGIGTGPHMAVVDQIEAAGVPDLFVIGGEAEWARDPIARPTIFGSIHENFEAAIMAIHLIETYPGRKMGILSQEGVFTVGIASLKQAIDGTLPVVAEVSYPVGPVDLSEQLTNLHDAGVEVIASFAVGPYFADAVRHARVDMQWDVPFVTAGPGRSGAEMLGEPADGVVSISWIRLPSEMDHPALQEHQRLLNEYTDLDIINGETIYGQYVGELTVEILRKAGPDLTRKRLLAAAESIDGYLCSLCIFPITMNANDHNPIDTGMLMRFDGMVWQPFNIGYSWEGILPDEVTPNNVTVVPSPYQ